MILGIFFIFSSRLLSATELQPSAQIEPNKNMAKFIYKLMDRNSTFNFTQFNLDGDVTVPGLLVYSGKQK